MTMQVNGFVTKPDNLSWMPRTYKEGEMQFGSSLSSDFSDVKQNI